MTVEEQLAAALAEVENLRMTIAEKDCMIQYLQNKLLWLRKKVFGQMSEKALRVDSSQLSLFEEKHLTDEERAQLDKEVEEAEKAFTKLFIMTFSLEYTCTFFVSRYYFRGAEWK